MRRRNLQAERLAAGSGPVAIGKSLTLLGGILQAPPGMLA
jgi:hypothetical protein